MHSGNVGSGNVASDDTRLERSVLSSLLVQLHGFDATDDFTVLSCTSRLLLVRVGERDGFRDRFPERDSGFTGDTLDVVLSLHALHVNIQVKLTHSGDDGLRVCG